jgi:hypothetical protein
MELTPEQMQRIRDEEAQQAAEEEYRARVRRELLASQAATEPAPKPRKSGWIERTLGIVAALFILIGVIGYFVGREEPRAETDLVAAPKVRYVPVSQKIVMGQTIVKAGGYSQFRIRIEPEMRDARISGSFNAAGGSGNDIEAAIAHEDEFLNYINGHQARVYYGTTGKKTTDHFDVRLGQGTYVLVFNNKFSTLSDKQVSLEVDLNYSRRETY